MKYQDDLNWIKVSLSLSMSDLALVLNISPSQLHHWLDTLSPPDIRQENLPRVREWIESNVDATYRKHLKFYWHHPLDSNATLLTLLQKLAYGESLGKIKSKLKIKPLLDKIASSPVKMMP